MHLDFHIAGPQRCRDRSALDHRISSVKMYVPSELIICFVRCDLVHNSVTVCTGGVVTVERENPMMKVVILVH